MDRKMLILVGFALLFLYSSISFATGISSCQNLNTEGDTYTLTANVNTPAICFNITANSVTLDCAGFLINYSQSITGYGINITSKNNTIIKNCLITSLTNTVDSPSSHGIYATKDVYNTTIYNNTINIFSDSSGEANAPFGVYFLTRVHNSSVYNNTIFT